MSGPVYALPIEMHEPRYMRLTNVHTWEMNLRTGETREYWDLAEECQRLNREAWERDNP